VKKVFLLLALVFVFTGVAIGAESISGSCENTITFAPQSDTESIAGLSSTLKLNYSSPGIDYTTTTIFTKAGYYSQTFGADISMGTFDIDSTLAFLASVHRMDYWLTKVSTVMASAYIAGTLLVEYVSDAKVFGTGMEFVLSGEVPGAFSIEVSSLFGMEESLVETLGWQAGSGYDIILLDGQVNPCEMRYESTTIALSGLTIGCCRFDATTRLSGEGGFEYTYFEFLIDSESSPLSFDVDLKFTQQDKSITLTPSLVLGGTCFEVYLDLIPVELTKDNNAITGLEVEGLGISGVELDSVLFSCLIALKGDLYRSKTAPGDISLRARNYVLEPHPLDAVYYIKTDYHAVFSIEISNDLNFGIDAYFDTKESVSLFDLALVTAETKYWLGSWCNFGTGISIKPETGPDQFTFSFNFYF